MKEHVPGHPTHRPLQIFPGSPRWLDVLKARSRSHVLERGGGGGKLGDTSECFRH